MLKKSYPAIHDLQTTRSIGYKLIPYIAFYRTVFKAFPELWLDELKGVEKFLPELLDGLMRSLEAAELEEPVDFEELSSYNIARALLRAFNAVEEEDKKTL
jgi:hypothetical protein